VVDYLQLVDAERKHGDLYTNVTSVSRDLKKLAQHFRIPVVVLSQLSRANAREKRPPQLSDLRDSGAIEQDADNVLFIHHPPGQEHLQPPIYPRAELLVAKHRNGPTGTANMVWHKAMMRFMDEAPGYRSAQEEPRASAPAARTPQIRRGNPNEH
jgi:replicative DNA helicase